MARPVKRGLDSFPLDVDIFSDEKMVSISGEFGVKGEGVVIHLLCAIYRQGYFVSWDGRLLARLTHELKGVSADLILQVVSRLVKLDFFDRDLFESDSVLTSRGIQTRYLRNAKRRVLSADMPYMVVPLPECRQKPATPLPPPPPAAAPSAPVTYEQEIEEIKNSEAWLDNLQISRGLSKEQLRSMLDKYLLHCREYEPKHYSLGDAKRHFLNWLGKQPRQTSSAPPRQEDYSFSNFGSIDT